jgi:hypothetical protein
MLLKGNSFQNKDVIMQLLAIPKSQFQKCFTQWTDHWNKCVMSDGDHFEGG